jgi:hypothetical protein
VAGTLPLEPCPSPKRTISFKQNIVTQLDFSGTSPALTKLADVSKSDS